MTLRADVQERVWRSRTQEEVWEGTIQEDDADEKRASCGCRIEQNSPRRRRFGDSPWGYCYLKGYTSGVSMLAGYHNNQQSTDDLLFEELVRKGLEKGLVLS